MKESWCIPPKANAAFVCQMEDVLDIYKRPYDPKRPQICMDEMPKQLLAEKYEPLPGKPGQLEKQDYEYERHGNANIFMLFEPLAGKRFIETKQHRKSVDWAHAMQVLSDVLYPDAEVIVLVMDNLNTHKLASFYEAFEPEEAHRLSRRFEIHYTPKHGSWLNMAEIELNVLMHQCLSRRIDNMKEIKKEVNAWQKHRNNWDCKIEWRFDSKNARIKLKKLYPSIHA